MNGIFTAESIEKAKSLASEKFGADEKNINFEIMPQTENGEFQVKAEYIPEKVKTAISYVSNILEKMGVGTEYTLTENDDGALLSFDTDGTGAIIGRRGETLDAFQYLVSMVCNRNDDDYYRITLDSCGYREKRKHTLTELAGKISKTVVRTGKPVALEPMNPYERRIIHASVAEIKGVNSKSTGEEPYRKVIISPVDRKPRRDEKRQKKTHHPRPMKSLDLTTSFEREYKKPKPEDNIKAGLYGKIEL